MLLAVGVPAVVNMLSQVADRGKIYSWTSIGVSALVGGLGFGVDFLVFKYIGYPDCASWGALYGVTKNLAIDGVVHLGTQREYTLSAFLSTVIGGAVSGGMKGAEIAELNGKNRLWGTPIAKNCGPWSFSNNAKPDVDYSVVQKKIKAGSYEIPQMTKYQINQVTKVEADQEYFGVSVNLNNRDKYDAIQFIQDKGTDFMGNPIIDKIRPEGVTDNINFYTLNPGDNEMTGGLFGPDYFAGDGACCLVPGEVLKNCANESSTYTMSVIAKFKGTNMWTRIVTFQHGYRIDNNRVFSILEFTEVIPGSGHIGLIPLGL